MADFEQLKASVASIIRTNGAEAITGAVLQDVLLTIINSISDGYMFGGVAQHSGSVGNPDYNVFYLGGSGSYTGYGGSIDVPAGSYCVFAYDGTWHQSVIDLGISLGGTVSEGETQGVTGDAVNTALNTLWENITDILDSIAFSDDTSELYKGDRITQGMRVTAGGVERLLSSFTILAATVQNAGLMSAADKRKLDNFVFTVQDMIETMTVSDVTEAGDTGTRIDESIEWTVDEVTHQIATFTLLAATAVKAGLMSNTDKQAVDALFTIEAEDTTAVDDLGVKLTETLNWTVNNVSQIFAEFTLLAATQSKAGLMSAADKAKLDAYENNIRSMEIVDTTGNADKGDQITETLRWVFGGVSTVITTFTLLAATHTKAGLMSAVDKQLVDALLTIIAQDTTAQADEKTSMTQSLKWTRGGTQQTMVSFSILAATAEKAGLMSADDKAKIDAMLTGGYMFAGVATTSTNPTTGTEKMFYIAIEAGEYTHFDGLTVDRGINILMYDGSDWNAVTVVGIDDEPTPNSSNLVESGGVYDSGSKLLSGIKPHKSVSLTIGSISNQGANIESTTRVRTDFLQGHFVVELNDDYEFFNIAEYISANISTFTGEYKKDLNCDSYTMFTDKYYRMSIKRKDGADFEESELDNIIKSYCNLVDDLPKYYDTISAPNMTIGINDTSVTLTSIILNGKNNVRHLISVNNTFQFLNNVNYPEVLVLNILDRTCSVSTTDDYVPRDYDVILFYRSGANRKIVGGALYPQYVKYYQGLDANMISDLGNGIVVSKKHDVDTSEGNRYVNALTGEYVASETSTNYANEIDLNGDEFEIQYYSAEFVSNPGGYAFMDADGLYVYGGKINSSYDDVKTIGNNIIKYAIANGAVKLRLSLYRNSAYSWSEFFVVKRIQNISPIDYYSLEKINPLSSRFVGFKIADNYEIVDYIGTEFPILPYMISEIANVWRRFPSGQTGERFSVLIPTKGIHKFLIHANSGTSAHISFLNDYPVEESTPPYCAGSGIIKISPDKEGSFVVPKDAMYLYVRLGEVLNSGRYNYIPSSIKVWGIANGALDTDGLSVIDIEQTNRNIVIGSPQVYSSPVRTSPTNLYDTTCSDIYAALDNLVEQHPDWIYREADLGNDSDGQPIRHYMMQWKHNTFCIQNYGQYGNMFVNNLANRANETFLKRRALLLAGVHGSEKGGVWGLIFFLQDLLSSNDQWAEFIKSNYILDLIPVICPWANDHNSRENKNGINVNRDYTDSPTSEEATAVVNYMKKIKGDVSCIFDNHTYLGSMGFYSVYDDNPQKSTLAKLFNAVIAAKVNDWQTNIKGNLVASDIYRSPFCFICYGTTAGTMVEYGTKYYTPFSTTIESIHRNSNNTPILAKQQSDMIGNALQSFLTVVPPANNLEEIGGYTVTLNAESGAASMLQEYPTFVRKGSSLTIPVMVGTKGHENISVMMGEADVTSTAYDASTNVIYIPFVTDNVVISISTEVTPVGYTPVVLPTELNKKIDTLLKGDLNTEVTILAKSNSFTNNYFFGDLTDPNKSISVPCGSNPKFGSITGTSPSYNSKAVYSNAGYSLMTVNKDGIFNQFGKQFEWSQEPSTFETEGNIYIGIANGISDYPGVEGNGILSVMIKKNNVLVFNARAVKRDTDDAIGFYDYISNTFLLYDE